MAKPQLAHEKAVGLIGVGLLGSALADRLRQHHVPVWGFDVDPTRGRMLESVGGRVTESAAKIFSECEIILLSLPTSQIAKEVVLGNREFMKADSVVVDTTTGDPAEMVAISALLQEMSVHYLEATVAASSQQVRRGCGTLLLGGNEADVVSIQWLLPFIAERYFHLGAVGSASRFKLVHNLLLGLHRAVLAEGLTFAESMGFAPQTTLEILRQTPAVSGVMETKGHKMVEADYSLHARLSQHLKDVRLILAEAERTGARTPLSEIHKGLLEQAEQLGFGDVDNSAVIEAFRAPAPEDGG